MNDTQNVHGEILQPIKHDVRRMRDGQFSNASSPALSAYLWPFRQKTNGVFDLFVHPSGARWAVARY